MAKRSRPESSDEVKFEIEKAEKSTLYAVISQFRNVTYVHLRKYYYGAPSKYGVCMGVKDWCDFIQFVNDGGEKFSTSKVQIHKKKNGVYELTTIKTDFTLYLKASTMESLNKR